MALGIVAAFVYSVTLLPALMAILPARRRKTTEQAEAPGLDRLARFVIDRRGAVFAGTLAVIVLLPIAEPRDHRRWNG